MEYHTKWQVIIVKRSWYQSWFRKFFKGKEDYYQYKFVRFED